MKLKTKDIILTSLFTALMILGAYIVIPFSFLPVTMQPIFCVLAGLIAGARLGALSMLVYTILGLTGIPVFAQGGGIAYIFNVSFGFILGFIVGAYLIGKISQRQKGYKKAANLKAALSGLIVIYSIGMVYMFMIMKLYLGNSQISFWYVIVANIPYLIKDLVLFVAAAMISIPIQSSLSRTVHQ